MARLRTLTFLVLLSALLACASGPAPRDHFYRLEVPGPESRREQPALPGVLEIERAQADNLVRERAIVKGAGDGSTEVTPYVYHLWVDSPTLLVQRELARWLDQQGLAEQTVLPEAGAQERWLVTGRLERFEHVVPEGQVLVVIELRLTDVRRGRLLHQRRYRAEAPSGADVPGAVRGFGTALSSIFGQFASDAAAAAR